MRFYLNKMVVAFNDTIIVIITFHKIRDLLTNSIKVDEKFEEKLCKKINLLIFSAS